LGHAWRGTNINERDIEGGERRLPGRGHRSPQLPEEGDLARDIEGGAREVSDTQYT